jgi:hypothetical protein
MVGQDLMNDEPVSRGKRRSTARSELRWWCHRGGPHRRLPDTMWHRSHWFFFLRVWHQTENSPRVVLSGGVIGWWCVAASGLLQPLSMMPRFSKACPVVRSSKIDLLFLNQAHCRVLSVWAAMNQLGGKNSKLGFVLRKRSKLMAMAQLFIGITAPNHSPCREEPNVISK